MRCFVALEIGVEVKKNLSHAVLEAKALGIDASFVKPEQAHITLAFLGEISEEEAARKIAAFKTLDFPAFDLEVRGLGFFPNNDYIRVLWAGCVGGELCPLQEKLAHLLELGGERECISHLTIARVRSAMNTEALKALGQKYATHSFGFFRAASASFKKSTLTPGGPVYEDLATVELK
ncbi:MAG: RNA 2',3'-cyclic phosphodiesterase [Candidatus Micrarchaeota archaeon]|nr:RNA 2',3'-cyclic phosphodiesterase [Candidatus Micrarchaeota archaeon]